jgi:hypothetical protein
LTDLQDSRSVRRSCPQGEVQGRTEYHPTLCAKSVTWLDNPLQPNSLVVTTQGDARMTNGRA